MKKMMMPAWFPASSSEEQRPVHRTARNAVLLVASWTLFGLFMAWQVYAMSSRMGRKISAQEALAGELIYAYAWALLTPLVWYLGRRFYLERGRFFPRLLLHIFASLAIALAHRALLAVARGAYRALQAQQPAFPGDWVTNLISYLDYGILLYWMIIILQHALVYYRNFQEQALQAAHLQAQLAQAQLQALRMQLQPHFLFNTLNAISVLIPKDAEAARRMLRHLSEFLRLTLQTEGAPLVPLSTELEFLDRYLQIERVRFGDRLSVQHEIAAAAQPALVPNLILQPLVENAVRHGLAAQRGAVRIAISATRENGTLRLCIRDNGRGLEATIHNQDGNGIGLTNTRARLQQHYGEQQRFVLDNAAEGGVVATMEIPFQAAAANA